MKSLPLIAPRSRNDRTNLRSDRDGKMTGSSLVGTVLARRYQILERIDVDSFRAHDLALDQTVTVRQAKLTSQRERDTWRQRVRRLASVRHPNFLNVLDLILDGSRDLVVTERPLGHSTRRVPERAKLRPGRCRALNAINRSGPCHHLCLPSKFNLSSLVVR